MQINAQRDDREYKRFVINVKVFDRDSGNCLGYSSNMHTGGMMLMSEEQISPGSKFRLIIKHIQQDDTVVEIPLVARCIWSNPGNNPDFYNAGLLFIDPGPKQILTIEELIWELARI